MKKTFHFHLDENGALVKCYHGTKSLLADYRFWIGMTVGYPLEHWLWEQTFLRHVLTDGEINRFPYTTLRDTTGGKGVMKLTVNMSAAQSTPLLKGEGWHTLSGWSPAMFKWIPAMRNKESAVDALAVPYKGLPAKGSVAE